MDENNKNNDDEIILNNETIFEFLRKEKNRNELQKLFEGFYDKVNNFILKSKNELNVKKRDVTEFTDDNLKKSELKLESFIKIAKDLYDIREKKIVTMALIKSRTNAKLIDVINLESFEKELFDNLINMLDIYKNKTLNFLNKNQTAEFNLKNIDKKEEENKSKIVKDDDNFTKKDENKENMNLRFTNYVPKFLDKELNVLGPFEEDDIASLPYEIAQLLLKKGRAEKIDF
ncbi:MAG: hypothetical protein ACOC3X_02605 [Nanoarchaeota archaeon]